MSEALNKQVEQGNNLEKMKEQIMRALGVAKEYGDEEGAQHKAWVIDQMVRCLTDCPVQKKQVTDDDGKVYEYEVLGESYAYREWVANYNNGEDGPNTYEWNTGVTP